MNHQSGKIEKSRGANFFPIFFEILSGLKIIAAPFLVGLIVGALIYLSHPSTARLIIAGFVVAVGLVLGIVWAIKVHKTTGTLQYMSKLIATPELDKDDEELS